MAAPEVTAKPKHPALGLSDQDVLDMYYYMVLARVLDERMWQLQRMGKARFVVSAPGHEGAQVAMIWPLEKERDWFVPYYRSLAACLVKGMTPAEILLSVLAKAADPSSGGRQMPGHYSSPRLKILSGSSTVGTQYPHAVGIAYAAKLRRTGEVVMVSIGEGGTSEGDWHEALNFAGVHRVPCIFCVENNRYAISVPLHKQMPVESVAVRAAGYGMPGVSVDGCDVLEAYRAAKEACDRARRGEGPTLLEFRVERLSPHTSEDQQERYRTGEDLEAARQRDPLVRFRSYLRSVGLLDDAGEQALWTRVRREVDEATEAAERAPDPDPATAARHVYHDPDPGRPVDPVYWSGRE
ncbi:MAG: thiamine pyrophosphate-dependent dehydrogenase E1 component subunit alpha [Armatimonadota bacterium]|nr:thiamine pyrophosphate-dependent dehydrogenase E1 component subunit alpha [Armatimonadota bacterium]MDR7443408.1 thiamine pyrophosphate-dependent dehydrogenase E1 component subunit alpha [Armatimonadota bacterium]MDR7568917.1 thiamine pyrophosphate-dependent dehydrogenase E1 component subunit alpha [Armatimonadota bacterium]MDR7602405.1 thiamine pyrophosphate-dependent dehydrogenase E1 component subunit alpha [Armatimonadota bacterium]